MYTLPPTLTPKTILKVTILLAVLKMFGADVGFYEYSCMCSSSTSTAGVGGLSGMGRYEYKYGAARRMYA